MEETIRFDAGEGTDTIPALCAENQIQRRKPRMAEGMEAGEYRLLALMSVTAGSELWFGKDDFGDRCVVKITEDVKHIELIQKIRSLRCENLVPILDCGREGRYWYEVYPYYKNGCPEGILEEQVIKEAILPGLTKALECLHEAGIVHNDIKPENIFWDDSHSHILLGDYGCVTQMKERPGGYTPAYAAPELLLNDVSRRSSDWASVGLLLAKLADGRLLINAKSPGEARQIWEKGVFFSHASVTLKRLVNGMITTDPRKRLGPNAAKKWCGDAAFGGEERVAAHREAGQGPVTIAFENPPWIAADIDGLLKGIASHWDYGVFLFQQSRMDRFLAQFDKQWVNVCKAYRKLPNGEDALFRLTLDLTQNALFVWRGRLYHNLLEMEEAWEQDQRGEHDMIAFIQRGHVVFYLTKRGAAAEQIEFADRLQEASRIHPVEACAQLFQALRGNDGLSWGGVSFRDLDDVADWLWSNARNLDAEVDKLFQSKRFEAWMAYQGMEHVLEEIRRKCEG